MPILPPGCRRRYGDPRAGERLRDEALRVLRIHRPTLVRRLQRAMLAHLLIHGEGTSDDARRSVVIPAGCDPRVVGAAVRGLAEAGIIVSVGRRKSRRAVAHARKLDVWAIRDEIAARQWLTDHPEIGPSDDPDLPART